MPNLYTIGTGGKTAEQFFGLLESHGVSRVIDIRLRNTSQLAGFSKMSDFPFFLRRILDAGYQHETLLSPTDELLDAYRQHRIDADRFQHDFLRLLESRAAELKAARLALPNAALLCSEPSPAHCHRRVAADYLAARHRGLTIVHLE